MLESLRKKINDIIIEKQEVKQELYDRISNLDSDLLELNEILVKLMEEDAFLKISPYEAFEILDKLGYSNGKDKFDIYFELVRNKNTNKKEINKVNEVENVIKQDEIKSLDNTSIKKEVIEKENKVKYNNYEDKIENSKEELTKDQRRILAKVIETLVDNIYDDDHFYYIARCKVSKFRVYYNLSILLSGEYKKEEIFDMVKKAFTYKTCNEEDKEKIENALQVLKDKIIEIK